MNEALAPADRRAAARDSLEALALGDAFGERWFPLFRERQQAYEEVRARRMPREKDWRWTDDTAMALGVLRVLEEHGEVDPTALAAAFGQGYAADPGRGYGAGMHELLPHYAERPERWPELAPALFGGEGSLGNGAAMRVAPLGAWFCDDLERAVAQAEVSARVTHAHPQAVAGAVAVAVAAALAARARLTIAAVAEATPPGAVRDGLLRADQLPFSTEPGRAADALGSGGRVRADDTVPFAVWTAARHTDDLVSALWATAEGFGDVDTTCAITAGIVGARTGTASVSEAWLKRRESLPGWVTADAG
ncbi:ADP-ribosylglycohydrolase family protein [Streptomyces sp. SID4919]|uniref:ADP-ribosylglycohydrolase family protein n=1 Tax=unclassified Streptomyces TaxID=2593676 RepID=UPI000823D01E|nr:MULTISPECIES: ADP-ribosylglycohydrolase family protein [unclassified Streptomyces]MYY12737.1 ADP-ribosylglycohydrolase family protein [Streptomyces sp. SID4919]SCK21010.1 ADP-ribosylglycohydrolase [Streptomyces sp. AmelKG-E11A]